MGKQESERGEPRVLALPRPDPRHPEGVLDTVPRAAGIERDRLAHTLTPAAGRPAAAGE